MTWLLIRIQWRYVLEPPKPDCKKICSFHLGLLKYSLLEYLLWGKLTAMVEAQRSWTGHVMSSPDHMEWLWKMRYHVERERSWEIQGTKKWWRSHPGGGPSAPDAPSDAKWTRDLPSSQAIPYPLLIKLQWKQNDCLKPLSLGVICYVAMDIWKITSSDSSFGPLWSPLKTLIHTPIHCPWTCYILSERPFPLLSAWLTLTFSLKT